MFETTAGSRPATMPWVLIGGLLAWALVTQLLGAEPPKPVTTRLPTPVHGDGASGDNFGIAVAVDGDTAVVGAYGDTVVATGATFGVAQGAAYVFQRNFDNWVSVQKLSPQPVGDDGDNFGVALTLSADVLAVGAPRRSPNGVAEAGGVFVYTRGPSGFVQTQVLAPIAGSVGQRFGTALALWRDQLVVGSPQAAPAGRVDVYQRVGAGSFVYQRSILAADSPVGAARFGAALAIAADGELLIGAPAAGGSGAIYRTQLQASATAATRLPVYALEGAELGAALAIDGDLALAGAPGAVTGEVRVLKLDETGWQQSGVLTSPATVDGDRFGSSVAVDGNRAVVAAIAALLGEGATFVYDRDGDALTPLTELDIADGGTGNRFGAALALVADGVLIGADLDQVGPNPGQGSVRWYQPTLGGLRLAATLDSGDGAMFDRYGTSVAVDGDTALIGAYLEDTIDGADAGSAHWYQRQGSNWVYGGVLHAPDASSEDRFGIAVDVDGDTAVVGAYWDVIGDNVDQGSAYVYRRIGGQWTFEAKLTANDGRARDLFGFALSLSGDRLLVGARGAVVDRGSAYVFVRSGSVWQQEARIEPPPSITAPAFGTSLALVGDRALIGAPLATVAPGPIAGGAAYVYERAGNAWVPMGTLVSPTPVENEAFGFSVAADRDRFLIGAFESGFAVQGAAYVFKTSDRKLDGVLTANSQPGEGLGVAVALSGATAILGGSGYDFGNLANAGTVRVFERSALGWQATQQWLANDADYGDGFGRALAIDRGTVLVGAPFKGGDNPLEGMAYAVPADRLYADGFE